MFRNIGLADGGTQRLPRITGMGRALEMIITGRVIGPNEAMTIGLANEVLPPGKCMERALELASSVADLPLPVSRDMLRRLGFKARLTIPKAIMADKEAAVRGFGRDINDGLRIEAQCFNRLPTTEEFRDGSESSMIELIQTGRLVFNHRLLA